MSAKKTARSLSRQLVVFGLLGCFVAIGYSRLSHYSSPHGMLWTFLVQGGIGFGIGAALGLLMYQFKDARLSRGKPTDAAEKDEAECEELDNDRGPES